MRGLAVFTLLATLVLINASPFTVLPEDTTTTEGGSGDCFDVCCADLEGSTSNVHCWDRCWNECMGFGPEDTTTSQDSTTPEDTTAPEDTTTTTPEPATSTLREYEILWQ